MPNKLVALLFILLMGFGVSPTTYAEGGGFRFAYNDFTLYLEFNDNVPEEGDEVTGMGYIREPSGFFYDLLSLIQANQKIISKSKQYIYINPDNINQTIWIKQQEPVEKWILELDKLKHFDSRVLLENTCKALNIKKCVPPESTHIYVSDIPLAKHKVDLVEFGCFPCNNDLLYTFTDDCSTTSSDVKKPKFKKITITRKTINKYFRKLD